MQSHSCRIVVKGIQVLDTLDPKECGDVCPSDALKVEPTGVKVNPSLCLACLACMALCGPDRVKVIVDWVCS